MKAIVIGLDGASPSLIARWKDDLPNIGGLADSGVQGILKSIVPPSSVPAWQCFAAGKNPGKIGLFGFATIGRDHRLIRQVMRPDQGYIWDLCSQNGLTTGVYNVPGTYPPFEIKGFTVCGFPVPPGKDWAYPRDLMERLDKAVDGYEIDVPLTKPSEMRGGERAYLSQVDRLHDKSLNAALALMDWYNLDFYFLTLQGVDMVQHDFWRYMEQHSSEYSNVVHDWYQKIDSAVGELVRKVDPNTYVVIMSDHGSVPVSLSFHINECLQQNDLLVLKDRDRVAHKGSSYTKVRTVILKTFPASWVNAIYKAAPEFIARKLTTSAKLERFLTDLIDNIDWERTRAFSTGGVQANLYLQDDTPSTSENVEALLGGLSHPTTGEKIRAVFHNRNDAFSGPFAPEAPDICVELFYREEKVHVNPALGSSRLWSFEPHLSAEHVREGYWSIRGPGITPGIRLDASILDIVPTLASLLGLQVPRDCDGMSLGPLIQSSGQVPLARAITS